MLQCIKIIGLTSVPPFGTDGPILGPWLPDYNIEYTSVSGYTEIKKVTNMAQCKPIIALTEMVYEEMW